MPPIAAWENLPRSGALQQTIAEFVAEQIAGLGGGGQILFDAADSPQTTTSTTLVDVAGSSLSVVIPVGQTADVLLIGVCTAENSTAGKVTRMGTNWDGADGDPYVFMSDSADQRGSVVALQVIQGVTAGTYAAKLRKSVNGGTGTYRQPLLVAVVVAVA